MPKLKAKQMRATTYTHTINNPFTGEKQQVQVDITTEADKAELEALKRFMKVYLSQALTDELKADQFKYEKMQYLIVQLYQPSTLTALIIKLMKFSEYLEGIKEFDDVFKTFRGPSSTELTVNDFLNNNLHDKKN